MIILTVRRDQPGRKIFFMKLLQLVYTFDEPFNKKCVRRYILAKAFICEY